MTCLDHWFENETGWEVGMTTNKFEWLKIKLIEKSCLRNRDNNVDHWFENQNDWKNMNDWIMRMLEELK